MNPDLRILFVNNFRGRGGGEEFLRDFLPGLADRGAQVGLICRPGAPLAGMFSHPGIQVHPLERSGWKGVSAVLRMARIISEQGYRIVNIQRGHDILQSWLAARLSGAAPVLMYTPQVPEFLRSRILLRRMDAVATISRHIRDQLIGFDPSLAPRTTIIHYGIDLERFAPAAVPRGWLRQRFGVPPDATIIGTVGDLWKNQIEFLDVLAELRREHPQLRYAIVGAPKENDLLREFTAKAGALGLADAVLWAGRLAKDEMLAFYADIDLAVSTYRNEGFGIWVLEAMAMGRPVAAYDAGGIRDSLEGSPAGVLISGGPLDMARTIGGLLKDPARAAAMGAAAHGWVLKRFSRARMIDDYERYFAALLERTATAPASRLT